MASRSQQASGRSTVLLGRGRRRWWVRSKSSCQSSDSLDKIGRGSAVVDENDEDGTQARPQLSRQASITTSNVIGQPYMSIDADKRDANVLNNDDCRLSVSGVSSETGLPSTVSTRASSKESCTSASGSRLLKARAGANVNPTSRRMSGQQSMNSPVVSL